MAWTAPRTWIAGEVVTAALLNTHLRDNLLAIGDPGAWTAWTPTFTQGVGVGISSNASRWKAIGKTITAQYYFAVNGAGTATAAMQLSLPALAASTTSVMASGVIMYQDTTGASVNYKLIPLNGSTSQFSMTDTVPTTIFGNSPAVTAAVGDALFGTIVYEGA